MENTSHVIYQDGTVQIQQLTPEYLEEALDIMDEAFYRDENVCKALGIGGDSKAIAEIAELLRATAKDGISVIAVDKETNKVVGTAFNKLQVKDTHGEPTFFDTFKNSCEQPKTKELVKLMVDVDNLCNLFDYCQVDCLMEITFVGTLPRYRRRGIANKLCEASIEIGRKLLNGVNVKISIDGQKLGLEPVAKIATAIFSSFITQKIGKGLGFQVVAEKSYEMFEYEGRTYASIIGKETPTLTLEYRKFD